MWDLFGPVHSKSATSFKSQTINVLHQKWDEAQVKDRLINHSIPTAACFQLLLSRAASYFAGEVEKVELVWINSTSCLWRNPKKEV